MVGSSVTMETDSVRSLEHCTTPERGRSLARVDELYYATRLQTDITESCEEHTGLSAGDMLYT